MKYKILSAIAMAGLLTGCAEVRHHAGASALNDHNVLTGGPVTGTTISDLPQAVRDTLRQRAANAEIADIDKETWDNGLVVYQVQFIEPGKNPILYISEDGKLQRAPASMDR